MSGWTMSIFEGMILFLREIMKSAKTMPVVVKLTSLKSRSAISLT